MKWTLLLRLGGPLQAWGIQSRFTERDTGREPSKSGVIGLLCAALGKPRVEDQQGPWPTLGELASLRLGVRVDQEGVVMRDYHTAGGGRWATHETYGVPTADGKSRRTVVSRRYFLADADFLTGLESSNLDLLHQLDAALAKPCWQLSLGRKSFVPSVPVRLPDKEPFGPGLRQQSLEQALRAYPYQPLDRRGTQPHRLRLMVEATPGEITNEIRNDVPLSFAAREFGLRYVRTEWMEIERKAM